MAGRVPVNHAQPLYPNKNEFRKKVTEISKVYEKCSK